MPNYIVKLIDKNDVCYYLEWSTIVDSPISYGTSLEEFKEYYKNKYGTAENQNLQERLDRVEKKGTSSLIDTDVIEVLFGNRAGPGESPLSYDEIIRWYCHKEEFDEKHPCWEQRYGARAKLIDEGGYRYEQLEEIIAQYPYPPK